MNNSLEVRARAAGTAYAKVFGWGWTWEGASEWERRAWQAAVAAAMGVATIEELPRRPPSRWACDVARDVVVAFVALGHSDNLGEGGLPARLCDMAEKIQAEIDRRWPGGTHE
jgi:hypothetical protein